MNIDWTGARNPQELIERMFGALDKEAPMAYLNDAPCRVTAETNKYEGEQREAAAERIQFDEGCDDHVRYVAGQHLAKPVQELLLTLANIESVSRSFGDDMINKAKFFDSVLPELRALRDSCIAAFNDL